MNFFNLSPFLFVILAVIAFFMGSVLAEDAVDTITNNVPTCSRHCKSYKGGYSRIHTSDCTVCCTKTQIATTTGYCQSTPNGSPECYCSYYKINGKKPVSVGDCDRVCHSNQDYFTYAKQKENCANCCKNKVASVKGGYCARSEWYNIRSLRVCLCSPITKTNNKRGSRLNMSRGGSGRTNSFRKF